jgi:lipoprotein-anchoring transpeptidase ErfK/SrfK
MNQELKRKLLVGLFGFLSVFSLISAAAAGTTLRYHNLVLPNTHLAGVSIGNSTPEQALNTLRAKAEALSSEPLSLQLEEKVVNTSLSELGVKINPEQSSALVTASDDIFLWLKPRYWKSFFSAKAEPLPFTIDEERLRTVLNEKFAVSNTAKDAVIVIENNNLIVQPASNGIWLDFADIETQITEQITNGSLRLVIAKYTETEAAISTAAAEATKTVVVESLKPITLQSDNRKFTLTAADQYTVIDYTANNGELDWSISKEKLSALLNSKVASKINLKMIQKTILSDTGEVTNQGRDGKEVELAALTNEVTRIITERAFEQPVPIPVRTVALTERIIHPDYVANLFPGLYVDISLKTQTLYIMNGPTRVNQFLISSGRAGTPTPKGLFYIKNKIDIAQSRLYPGIWMRNWNALSRNPDGSGYEGYGIHDLPAFNAAYTIIEGSSHLGRPVSHGCVRLGHEASIWFYQNIPIGTPVNIH